MIPAALLGFTAGTLIAWWVVLRSLSHGERDFEPDPLDEVQPVDPRILTYFNYETRSPDPPTYFGPVTRTFTLDCE